MAEPPTWPVPADFGQPPSPEDRERWRVADAAARPARLDRLRARFAAAGVDGYLGIRPEHTRYLTGMVLDDGEEKVAGQSGWFVATADELAIMADSRYRVQVGQEAPEARIEPVYHDLAERWPAIVGRLGVRRLAAEAGALSHATWLALQAAAPDVELVPVDGWLEADRAVKEPAEVERIAAACAVADRALAALLPEIRAGVTERSLAVRLEWLMRTDGADGLAFDVACLSGPQAALPHGSPAERAVATGAVLLFDFGARVDGYRSDMTRTLFVGDPSPADLELYELVAGAQAASIALVEAAAAASSTLSGRAVDAAARQVIAAAGRDGQFGHGTGHGIGLATHEEPRLSRTAPETPLPSPTVFSVEPGVYVDGETGVRIEDLVLFDAGARTVRRLTRFPREVLVVG